jgi:hypothetical protein
MMDRKKFLAIVPFPFAFWAGWKFMSQTPGYVGEGTGTGHEEYGQEDKSPWVPVCWCGLSGDDVTEVGDSGAGTLYKCMNRHSFFAPWEKDKP